MLGGLAGLVGLSAVAGVLVTATITPAIALSGAAASSAITMFDNLPSELEIDKLMLPTTIYYKHAQTGETKVLTQFYDQNRSPVTYDEISPVMYDAILSSEDPRYYEHGGIDLIGTTRAVLSNIKGGAETQGGSSISQQYVKNILVQRCEATAKTTAIEELTAEAEEAAKKEGVDPVAPTADEINARRDQVNANCWSAATTAKGNDGIQRKLQEMRYAISLEKKYSKEDILLGYLNIANFGGTTYGIDAAARYYFNVASKDLSVGQAAILAGIVQNPNSYRIDLKDGSIFDSEGNSYNKAPDGVIDEGADLRVLDSLVESGEITEEQRLEAADGYTSTKVRQLYVLSRMLEDGKITREEYVAAAAAPITPEITRPKDGCASTGAAAYFCQYVVEVIKNDPAFGETEDDRLKALRQGGLKIYTTLDTTVQKAAEVATSTYAPTSISMPTSEGGSTGRFGSATVSIEADTGRILAIAQNTKFSEDASVSDNPDYSSLVFAGDTTFGGSTGFAAGSTFKLFTLVDWLEQGNSVNQVLNGSLRVFPKLTNSCDGDWYNESNTVVNNFGKAPGRIGTPMQFTASSLNTGYFAMAEKLDLCDIKKVATKMGVTQANGKEVAMDTLASIIGTNYVSPIAIAGAYATVANKGVYCQPQVIDAIVDADGNDMAIPKRSCSQVIDPKVAATAAYALQGVMASGGTGSQGNTWDGTPLIGKTGTHEAWQTWLVESSTKVATATWAGNVQGNGDVFRTWTDSGYRLSDIRYSIAKATQAAANARYAGAAFPAPDTNLSRQVLTDLPNVVGKTVEEATKILTDAGFTVTVGSAVDSSEDKDIVAEQDPAPGKVSGGATVTISPSNGRGITVPDVSGRAVDRAVSELRSAGFGDVRAGTCVQDDNAGRQDRATVTNPAAGSVVNRNTSITVDYTSRDCGGGGNGNGSDDSDG